MRICMRFLTAFFILQTLSMSLICSPTPFTYAESYAAFEPTGKEWFELSDEQRVIYIGRSLQTYKEWGVQIKGRTKDYITWINQYLTDNEDLVDIEVKHILAHVLRENKPQVAEAFDDLGRTKD